MQNKIENSLFREETTPCQAKLVPVNANRRRKRQKSKLKKIKLINIQNLT